jgi:16S rRNA (guanine(966)-N(2))-methyltransferase RsmD
LDLFAGTGSVGIEALSRGAAFARFIDREPQAAATVRLNLETTGLTERAQVIRVDAFTYLAQLPDCSFDYIYIAPPQYKELWKRALLELDSHPAWLSPDAWVIVQIYPGELQAIELRNLVEFDQRKYGSTLLVFYTKGNNMNSEQGYYRIKHQASAIERQGIVENGISTSPIQSIEAGMGTRLSIALSDHG